MTSDSTKAEALDPQAKRTLRVVFFTLFMDLVSFSLIFPMFPALVEHYILVDPENPILRAVMRLVDLVPAGAGEPTEMRRYVVFGGIVGALYSFLQFLFAPFWGSVSDRIGRKPVLLICVAGLTASYLLWAFSGSFTLLIVSRALGGIMAGNISTATAVVADVTSMRNRSRGMVYVGIAFALGFVTGPAIGGLLTRIDLATLAPATVAYGINPFSMPAFLAFALSAANLAIIFSKLDETLPPNGAAEEPRTARSANPFFLLRPFPYPGVNLANYSHFLFLTVFAGTEFTLTFLAVERLGYTPLDNAYMFIFIGLIIALVQGGIVRAHANRIGERRCVLIGLLTMCPGFFIIGAATTAATLYAGIFFMAAGAALAIPCMTALVSMFSPAHRQGQVIGVFRSLGALARVVGPLIACVLYRLIGNQATYVSAAIALLLPAILVTRLPAPGGQAADKDVPVTTLP